MKEIVRLPYINTIADGIAVKKPGELTFKIISEIVDDIVLVSNDEIMQAICLLLFRNKILAELAGGSWTCSNTFCRYWASKRVKSSYDY